MSLFHEETAVELFHERLPQEGEQFLVELFLGFASGDKGDCGL